MAVAGYWAESGRAGSVALIRNRGGVFAWTAGLLLLATASGICKGANTNGVSTYPLNNNPQVREAYQHLYVLDYDSAVTRFEQIAAAHPNDAMAEAYLLNAVVMRELYRLDLLDTTFYANDGFLTGKHPVPEDSRARDHIFSLCDTVVGLSEQELKANNKDVNALYARGWARSLKAAYMAMVERSFSAALHLALQARTDNEKVLAIDPNYVDAKMVVGIYQYVIGALPFAFKIMVGFAGIHGSKSEGMKLLQDSASRGVLTKVESKTVIALFLRREGKYQEAIVVIRGLKSEYPRDFLFCLEEANLLKDAGEGQASIAAYKGLVAEAQKSGYFPSAHRDLAYFGLAESYRGQNEYAESAAAYTQAAWDPGAGAELKRRALVAAGQMFDLLHERDKALASYHAAVDAGPDTTQADQAKKYIRSAYTLR